VAGALFGLTGLVARGLWRGTYWAWWSSLALAAAGLFFVLPLAGTILLGGPTEPVGTGWDVVFFPLTAAVLVALLIALWTLPKSARTRSGSNLEGS
jgi:Na+-driven multidrug efflux pump